MALVTMKDYIYETPHRVLHNLSVAKKLVDPLVNLYTQKNYDQITFVASGSSYTALHCARNHLCKTLQTDIKIINPFTFAHYDYQYVKDNHFVVIVSQSGASTNCIDALKKLSEINHEKYVLTGNVNSDCKKYADQMIDWGCGTETMGYVTLGVVTLIVFLMLFAVYVAKKNNISDQVDDCQNQIKQAMELHKLVCQKTETFISQNYQALMQMDNTYILGCGSNYGTALEGALKIGETVKILAVGYEQDEFLHGPALQLNPHYSVFVIDGGDETSQHANQVFSALEKVTPLSYMITSQQMNHPHVLSINNSCDEPFTCLYYLPFFELIAEVISNDINSKKSHPLYYEMNKVIDFRTQEFRKNHAADND